MRRAVPGDITRADTITRVVQEAIDTFGGIDILVNNIGGGPMTRREPPSGPLGRMRNGWDVTFEQNLRASVLLCKAVAPHFIERKRGKIVNIGSVDGRYTPSALGLRYDGPPSYCAMKVGLLSYTQSLAELLGPHNINVNCICPGNVRTDVWKGISKKFIENVPELKGEDPEEFFDGIVQHRCPDIFASIPLRRASHHHSQVVAQVLGVDGADIGGVQVWVGDVESGEASDHELILRNRRLSE